ncbi:MAG: hypothetical protein WC044_10170 [Crocinitomicaceae bacterium]
MNQLKKEFPKIDRIVCDVEKEEDLDALVARCMNVYPFLDNVIHHNYHRELIYSKKSHVEIAGSIKEAKKLSLRLLPIFANKPESAMVFTFIDTQKEKVFGQKNYFQNTQFFAELRQKSKGSSVEMIEMNVPIEMLKIPTSHHHLKAIHHIHDNLYDWERGNFTRLKKNESLIKKWLKWIKQSYFYN